MVPLLSIIFCILISSSSFAHHYCSSSSDLLLLRIIIVHPHLLIFHCASLLCILICSSSTVHHYCSSSSVHLLLRIIILNLLLHMIFCASLLCILICSSFSAHHYCPPFSAHNLMLSLYCYCISSTDHPLPHILYRSTSRAHSLLRILHSFLHRSSFATHSLPLIFYYLVDPLPLILYSSFSTTHLLLILYCSSSYSCPGIPGSRHGISLCAAVSILMGCIGRGAALSINYNVLISITMLINRLFFKLQARHIVQRGLNKRPRHMFPTQLLCRPNLIKPPIVLQTLP